MKAADVLTELAAHAREQPGDAPVLARLRALLEDTAEPFSRAQFAPGHLTCSACVLDAAGERVALLHHAKLGRWLQPGGHAEPGDATPEAAARREVLEECGLDALDALSGAHGSAIVDVDVHEIPARGADPAHLHFDLRHAFAARPGARLASDESHALRWVEVGRVGELTREASVTRLVARAAARFQSSSR